MTTPVPLIGKPMTGDKFFQYLSELCKKDTQDHPTAYVGLVIYPINGRAATVDPFDHYSMHRDEVIGFIREELERPAAGTENEVEATIQLLQEGNNCVRCGRIICHILEYPRSIPTTGVEIYVLSPSRT